MTSPDYVGVDAEQSIKDFILRIKQYEKVYQTLTKSECVPYVKLINVGEEVQMYKIHGYIQSKIVYFLMNLNITPKHLFFSRHGESAFNLQGKIGGDSLLSERGLKYAKALPALLEKHLSDTGDERATVWTSTLKRTIQTASFLKYTKMRWRQLVIALAHLISYLWFLRTNWIQESVMD